jgi:putative ABC transport system ATP-binding protein
MDIGKYALTEPLVQLSSLRKIYDSLAGEVEALKGIDLNVYPGEFLVVMGKSGAGKTTLVNMVTGLDCATSGEIWIARMPLHRMNAEKTAAWRGLNVGVVFQSFELMPTLSILQNVTLPMDFARLYPERERRRRAMALLEQLGISEHAHKPPSGISGGQQQRVAIARAMANDPPLLVADEPTGSLDSATATEVINVFERLAANGKAILLVTHDSDIASRASRVISLRSGEIVC